MSRLFFSRSLSLYLSLFTMFNSAHTRDVRREWIRMGSEGGRMKATATKKNSCVNLIVEIKADTYDDLANSL